MARMEGLFLAGRLFFCVCVCLFLQSVGLFENTAILIEFDSKIKGRPGRILLHNFTDGLDPRFILLLRGSLKIVNATRFDHRKTTSLFCFVATICHVTHCIVERNPCFGKVNIQRLFFEDVDRVRDQNTPFFLSRNRTN